ncbi:hypothetical protein [Anabaena sp. FACHB-1237]|uniref:hypothetical protein n=1 Tax=Anabaena sp. FACHB-1237 TaxID=2692769 RepID=UPI001F54CBE6|nr:hypothetical protein [Anabaena sp. FACHB-1237]
MAALIVIFVGHSTIDSSFTNETQKTLALSQNTNNIDAKKALELVWSIPQIRKKAREIEKLSQGTIRVSIAVDSSPSAEQPYYVIKTLENHADNSTIPIYWLRVFHSGKIEALDIVNNQYIPVEKWHPDGR